ncbi:MAG: SoxXA-binding protein [Gammaproteobacteria bacterium]
MSVKKIVAAFTLAAGFTLASGLVHAAEKAAAEKVSAEQAAANAACKAADESRAKASGVGGEWRDTGKLIKKGAEAAAAGDFAKAVKACNEAALQGKLGYEQATSQKDIGTPAYMK